MLENKMQIKNIEEAKKYLDKIIYTASDIKNRGEYKVIPLYIGGINLYYNQVNYDVEGFAVWEDKNYKNYYGKIEKDRIVEVFNEADKNNWNFYFSSKSEAERYCIWIQKDDDEREKEYDKKTAKELLEKHKIKYEIFN